METAGSSPHGDESGQYEQMYNHNNNNNYNNTYNNNNYNNRNNNNNSKTNNESMFGFDCFEDFSVENIFNTQQKWTPRKSRSGNVDRSWGGDSVVMDFDDFVHKKKMKLGKRLLSLNGYENPKRQVEKEVDQLHRMKDKINEKQSFIRYLDSIPCR